VPIGPIRILNPLGVQRESLDSIAREADRRARRLRVIRATMLVGVILIGGTEGFRLLTGDAYSLIDCFYMTVITISTVGFNEVIPITGFPDRQLYTGMLIIFGGGSLIYFLSAFTAMVIEGDVFFTFWSRRMGKRLEHLHDHVIVAGVGRNGGHVIDELMQAGTPTLAIDTDATRIDDVLTHHPHCLVMVADALDEATLLAAHVERAKALVATLPDDRDNLFLALTARQIAPDLRIVAKVEDERNVEKLERVGVSQSVSPTMMGGHRMAAEVLRPEFVRLTEAIVRPDDVYNIAVVDIGVESEYVGRTLKEFQLEDVSGCTIMGMRGHKDREVRYHPDTNGRLEAGGSLVAVGTSEQLRLLRQDLGCLRDPTP